MYRLLGGLMDVQAVLMIVYCNKNWIKLYCKQNEIALAFTLFWSVQGL
jgi:hypothetical protein